jgi:hypothetical protein
MALLSIAGFIHAYRTPKTITFGAPEDAAAKSDKPMANV